MPDILHERRLTLSQAAQHLGVHTCTVHRWRLRGVRGVRLETIVIGGRRVTSHEALTRFAAACSAVADRQEAAAQ
jgi:hypothetical protein